MILFRDYNTKWTIIDENNKSFHKIDLNIYILIYLMVELKEGYNIVDLMELKGERLILKLVTSEDRIEPNVKLVTDDDCEYSYQMFRNITPEGMDNYMVKHCFECMIQSTIDFFDDPNSGMYDIFYEIYYGELLVGNISIYLEGHDAVQIGLYISKAFSGMGFGTESTKLVVELIKKNLKVDLIIYNCEPDNIGSINVALKSGFQQEENPDYDQSYYYIYLSDVYKI